MTAWRHSGTLQRALVPALAIVTALRNMHNRVAQAVFRCTDAALFRLPCKCPASCDRPWEDVSI